jgi:tRNA pseudouridine38-40 synthase
LNAILPEDVWVAAAHDMRPEFHARYSAISRRYAYYIGTDDAARSPFRRRTEYPVPFAIDRESLRAAAAQIVGPHSFRAFAVKGTAPEGDAHRCDVQLARWDDRADVGGLVFEIEANRFLHHMVRFLVGTMLDMASGRRPLDDMASLLRSDDNSAVSAPAPANALFLDAVRYPADLYVTA